MPGLPEGRFTTRNVRHDLHHDTICRGILDCAGQIGTLGQLLALRSTERRGGELLTRDVELRQEEQMRFCRAGSPLSCGDLRGLFLA